MCIRDRVLFYETGTDDTGGDSHSTDTEIGNKMCIRDRYWEKAAYEEAEHAAKFAELLGEVVTDSTKKNLEMRVDAEHGATAVSYTHLGSDSPIEIPDSGPHFQACLMCIIYIIC